MMPFVLVVVCFSATCGILAISAWFAWSLPDIPPEPSSWQQVADLERRVTELESDNDWGDYMGGRE